MSKFQKKMAIVGAILTALGIAVTLFLGLKDKNGVVKYEGHGTMIEQRVIGGGGGGTNGVEVTKTIRIRTAP